MENKISAIIPVYNEEESLKETLNSLRGIVNEIIVIHDGECKNNTLKIARRFTKNVYVRPFKGRSAFPVAFGLKKAKYNWILKLDADESLSEDLRQNMRKLVEDKNTDAFSFIHPLWDGEKSITKSWPRKTSLARKSKITYLGFPGFDMNLPIKGKIKKTDYVLNHKPLQNQDVGWKGFKEKVLKRYAPSQAKSILKDFREFPTFQYNSSELPFRIRIRKFFPIFTNTLYAFLSPLKMLCEGAWKEGKHGFKVILKTFIYNIYLGYLIMREKSRLN